MALVGHAPSDFGGDLARKPCFMGKSFSKSLRHVLDIIGLRKDTFLCKTQLDADGKIHQLCGHGPERDDHH